MVNGKKITAVLPAYRAEKTLKQTFEAIPKDIVDEIILVDDASSDDTVSVSKKLGIKTFSHKKNFGYGANQKTCYKEALKDLADIIVMVHPDFQYDPKFIPEMVRPIAEGKADAVFGSRMLIPTNALKGGMPYWKFLANIFLTKLENFILGYHLSEYHSGFRAYDRKVIETLPIELNSNGFVFDTEIIAQMRLTSFKILEIPITTKYFKDASMIGFLKSCEYGTNIMLVMTQYILHRSGIVKFPKFITIEKNIICPNCDSSRILMYMNGNAELKNTFQKTNYKITQSEKKLIDNIYECVRCGMIFSDRMDVIPLLEDHYQNQELDLEYIKGEKSRRMSFGKILKQLNRIKPEKNISVLDIGCGIGFFLKEAEKYGYDVNGIELSEKAVDYAKNEFGLKKVFQGNVEQIGNIFQDRKFDVITAFDVLEHLPYPKKFFEEISKHLKKNGVLIMTIPIVDSPGARLFGKHWHAFLPEHINYFTDDFLKNLFISSGYILVSKKWHIRFLNISYVLARILKKQNIKWPSFLDITLPVILFDEMEIYLRP